VRPGMKVTRPSPVPLVRLIAAGGYRYRDESRPGRVAEGQWRLTVVAASTSMPSGRRRLGKIMVQRVLPGLVGFVAHPTTRRFAVAGLQYLAYLLQPPKRMVTVELPSYPELIQAASQLDSAELKTSEPSS
jgi:hypothetical protein